MKKLLILLTFFTSAFIIFSCKPTTKKSAPKIIIKKSNIIKKKIGVNGMTCVGCEVTLERAISKIHGVVKVKASASNDNALIQYDKTKTNTATIRKTIEKSGYTPFNIVEE